MKKHIILYLILVFLLIVNGFFVYHFMNGQEAKNHRKAPSPIEFISKELKLNDEQIKRVEFLNGEHHQKVIAISEDIKILKDALFNGLNGDQVDKTKIDSITSLIGQKEKEKDMLTFYHFKKIQELCNDDQKATFKKIINDALHTSGRQGHRPQPRH